jgi:hypothetical protein
MYAVDSGLCAGKPACPCEAPKTTVFLAGSSCGNMTSEGTMADKNHEPEDDEYDLFLQTWKPGEILRHSTLDSNLHDPVAQRRLIDDSSGEAKLERTVFKPGPKVLDNDEKVLRSYPFFEDKQAEWSSAFGTRLKNEGIDPTKVDDFVRHFATLWIDGKKRRQDSPEMKSIKASIRDHDRAYHRDNAGKFVIKPVADAVEPLFSPHEMKIIFEINNHLLENLMPSYLDVVGISSINSVYVRRGVYMPAVYDSRRELHELSSYSLASGPVEQFAQTWTLKTKDNGVPSIFSAPLPAIQDRVVAFAPFIEGMDLTQLEFVVAPPIVDTPFKSCGQHGGIYEFEFS